MRKNFYSLLLTLIILLKNYTRKTRFTSLIIFLFKDELLREVSDIISNHVNNLEYF